MRFILLCGILLLPSCALVSTPRPDPHRFAGEIAAFAKKEPEKGGIVFTGSSSIRMWPRFKREFSGLPVTNRGFGGSVTNDLIVHFDTLVARNEPKLLVTYSGNDLNKKLSVDEAFADHTTFLSLARERFPEIRVILVSVKITPRRAREIPRVHALNQRLQAWSAERPWMRYLDCTSYLAGADGQPDPAYFRDDQLHLSSAGYQQWQAILEPIVREEWSKLN